MSDFIELTHDCGDTIHLRPEVIAFYHPVQVPGRGMLTFIRMSLLEPNTILVKESVDEIAATIYAKTQSQRSSTQGPTDMMVTMLGALLSKLPNNGNSDESEED